MSETAPLPEQDGQDFGQDYLEFFPTVKGLNQTSISKVCIDGWFTAPQLRNIANQLDELEARKSNASKPKEPA